MLTTAEIKRFIDEDLTSEKKRHAAVGQRYYEAEHDILNCRLFYYNAEGILTEDKYRANMRISHPFFTELTDQLASYVHSFKQPPIRAKENAEGLQEHLDLYFDDEFYAETHDLVTGAYSKGLEYLYSYKNEDNRTTFQCGDSMGTIEVHAKDTDDGCKYVIYWYIDRIEKGKKVIKRIQVWNDRETAFFVQTNNGRIVWDDSVEINPRPHVIYTDEKTGKRMGYGLGYIPFWRLDNNKKQLSGLKPIKALIDDYDLMLCGLSNNLIDFDTPLHVVSGYQGDNLDELQTNLKTKKVVGVDAEGDIQVRTVDVPYEARKAKADEDEKNIYRFGMGLNMLGLKDTSATTNMAIKAAYTLLELKAKKMEVRLKKLLKDVVKIVLAEINEQNGTDYQLSDVEIEFEHDIITNETENLQNEKTRAETQQIQLNNILNIAASVGDEQTLKALCDVMEWDYEEIKGQVEKMQGEQNTTTAARSALEGVAVDDEDDEAAAAAPAEPGNFAG